jgi:hypothetical protein
MPMLSGSTDLKTASAMIVEAHPVKIWDSQLFCYQASVEREVSINSLARSKIRQQAMIGVLHALLLWCICSLLKE